MIGIIQGRLTEPRHGKIQSFPQGFWEREFETAHELGFDAIGWIFEEERWQENPLWTDAGREKLKECIRRTGVRVEYLCADYFMEHPFIRVSQEECVNTCAMLKEVMKRSADTGVRGVELPMVDNAAIQTNEERSRVAETLREFIPLMEDLEMEISIESSLPPGELKSLLETLDHPLFCITYDTGNSASLGYDTAKEIQTFGKWVHNIHIKDRVLHGTTVHLGSGNADFNKTFSALRDIAYKGSFTLQAARGGDPIENSKKQLALLHDYISTYLPLY